MKSHFIIILTLLFLFSCVLEKDNFEELPISTLTLTLTAHPIDAGTLSGAGEYETDAQINLTATPSDGYIFINWTSGSVVVSTTANFTYTMPAEDVTLVANFEDETLSIGNSYGGGIVAYIFQPGDPGYVDGEVNGIIAAQNDQGFAEWGCSGSAINNTLPDLGAGSYNTTLIIEGCNQTGIAAKLCNNLEENSYSDWVLPSIDELWKLYENKAIIRGFSESGFDGAYWSSTQAGNPFRAYRLWFVSGNENSHAKYTENRIRCIRYF